VPYLRSMSTQRLTPEKWIAAGFETLRNIGPHALAAETLARHIGATKGSFYWHFKDVPAFHNALLRHWQADAFAEVMDLLHDDGSADKRLRQFGRGILSNPYESSLRVWAQSAPEVAKVVAEVDAERLKYLGYLLSQLGLRNPDFARAMLACLIGLPQLNDDRQNAAAYDALVDTVLALT